MSELTEQEGKQLVEAFNKLKVKPKFDTTDELDSWLKAYSAGPSVKPEPGMSTTTVVSAYGQQPRISLFFGDNVKGEASYSQWVYEVKCLLVEKTHKPEVLAQAIRRSLRGEANNLVRRLGISATIPEILTKFESVYGEVDTKENLLAKFYSAKQEENEDVTKWSCRLEDILSSAIERKLVEPRNANEMLHNMFWQGLKPSLKDISGYKFEQISDFDRLRVELRKIEQDHLHLHKLDTAHSQTKTHCNVNTEGKAENGEIKELKTMVQSLTNTVKQLEKKVNSNQGQQDCLNQKFNNSKKYYGQDNTHQETFQEPLSFNNPGYRGNSLHNPRYNPRHNPRDNPQPPPFRGRQQAYSEFTAHQQDQSYSPNRNFRPQGQGQGSSNMEDNYNRGPLCFRCRQYGHYQWRCPVRMDHSRHHLN